MTSRILLVSAPCHPRRGGSAEIIDNLTGHFSNDEMRIVGEAPLLGKLPVAPKSLPTIHYFRSAMSFFGRGSRYFRALRQMRFGALVNAICRFAQDFEANTILGVYPDEMYCLAACRAAARLKLPFSSYFHNTYADNEAVDRRKAQKIQAEIFDNSRRLFVMSNGMKSFYDEKYGIGRKTVPLPHTFGQYPPKCASALFDSHRETTRIVLFGNFNESNVEATSRLVRAFTDKPRFEINIYTHVPKLLLARRGINVDAVNYRGFVPASKLHSELQQYDIAALTHGFTGGYGPVEYRTIFPTRTIPMLLSGRPMLIHSPPNSFLTEFSAANEIGELVCEASEEAIVAAAEKLRDDSALRETYITNARRAASSFEGAAVAAQLRREIGGIL